MSTFCEVLVRLGCVWFRNGMRRVSFEPLCARENRVCARDADEAKSGTVFAIQLMSILLVIDIASTCVEICVIGID